ncbi:hypothetical protein ACGFJ7_30380 [Actinoplanes sp. NPDC048988]|uniref:hypothetical protein n=1 Tax=Actinoplanes sp. NPDC048988 TaxID=3363901 RepID=UPI0037210A62
MDFVKGRVLRPGDEDFDAVHRPWNLAGRKPYFALSPSDSAAGAFDPDTLERLRAVKRRHDPRDVLRANYPVGG